jgi:hypothetical protein
MTREKNIYIYPIAKVIVIMEKKKYHGLYYQYNKTQKLKVHMVATIS